MEDNESDPWAELRKASQSPEAGRFAYNDEAPEQSRASAWGWIKFWFRVEFLAWLRKQVPLAKKSLDSSYYLGINRRKKTTSNAIKMAFGKEPVPEGTRIPIVIFERRIGIPGLLLVTFLIIVLIAITRNIFGF